MICNYRNCLITVPNGRRKFCSTVCGEREHQALRRNTLNPVDTTRKGDKCRWCIDPDHTEFCSDEHQMLYDKFRTDVDAELKRKKPKPTEKHLRSYQKIRVFLNKPL